MTADLRYDGCAEGHVRHEVAIHDIDLEASAWSSVFSSARGRTWSQSAPWEIVSEHAFPSAPKSADRIDGAMIAGGDIFVNYGAVSRKIEAVRGRSGTNGRPEL